VTAPRYSASPECEWTGKLAHPDRALALAHRADLAKTDPQAERLTVYRCGGHYHVGHARTTTLERRIRWALWRTR
jgi:hypothetical protein